MRKLSQVVLFAFFFISGSAAAQPWEVSGNISGPFGPVPNSEVQVYDSIGDHVSGTWTDGDGNYWVEVPADGDYKIMTPYWNLSDKRLLAEVYPNNYCRDCDIAITGSTFNVSGGDLGGIDLYLDEGAWVFGYVENSGSTGLPGVNVELIERSTGDGMESVVTDSSGYYELSAVLPGTYTLFFSPRTGGASEHYFDEMHGDVRCVDWIGCDAMTDGVAPTLVAGSLQIDAQLDAGTLISGTVTNSLGYALPWASVAVLHSTGAHVGQSNTLASGYWSVPIDTTGNYYAFTPDWSVNGMVPEVYNDKNCEPCDPELDGDSLNVSVPGADLTSVDFALDGGFHIIGHVSDNVPANLPGVEVCAADPDGGAVLGCAVTDGSGDYDIEGIQDSNNIVVYVKDTGIHAVAPEIWDGRPCCNFHDSDRINTNGGDVSLIDFELDPGLLVHGVMSGAGIGPFPASGEVQVYDNNGDHFWSATVNADGEWSMGLSAGNYRFLFDPQGDYERFVDTFHNGQHCPWGNCDIQAVPTINISGKTELNLTLDEGVVFKGRIAEEGGGPAIVDAGINFYDDSGNYIFGMGVNKSDGRYETPGLPVVNYLAFAEASWRGYLNEYSNGTVCPDYDCENNIVATDTPIPTATGNELTLNFDLSTGRTISGHVSADNGGADIPNIEVCVTRFDDSYTSCDVTDGSGDYSISGLLAETGWMASIGSTNGEPFLTEMYNNKPCCHWPDADPLDLTTIDETANFSLADGTIVYGKLTIPGGAPVEWDGAVDVFDSNAQHITSIDVNDQGDWSLALAQGNYYFYFGAWNNFEFYVDQFLNGTLCPEQRCDNWENTVPLQAVGASSLQLNLELTLGVIIEGNIFENGTATASRMQRSISLNPAGCDSPTQGLTIPAISAPPACRRAIITLTLRQNTSATALSMKSGRICPVQVVAHAGRWQLPMVT